MGSHLAAIPAVYPAAAYSKMETNMKLNSVTALVAAALLSAATAVPAFAQSGAPAPGNVPARSAAVEAPKSPAISKTAPAVAAKASHVSGGEQVKAVQTVLNRGGANLTVDGKMGPKTRAAVKEYQQKSGLPATGAIDNATRTKLGVS